MVILCAVNFDASLPPRRRQADMQARKLAAAGTCQQNVQPPYNSLATQAKELKGEVCEMPFPRRSSGAMGLRNWLSILLYTSISIEIMAMENAGMQRL